VVLGFTSRKLLEVLLCDTQNCVRCLKILGYFLSIFCFQPSSVTHRIVGILSTLRIKTRTVRKEGLLCFDLLAAFSPWRKPGQPGVPRNFPSTRRRESPYFPFLSEFKLRLRPRLYDLFAQRPLSCLLA
jgi:hypothetical protein